MRIFQKITFFFEMRSFGVCDWWGRQLGINSSKVRNGFIYAAVIGLGSPLIIYLVMAWVKNTSIISEYNVNVSHQYGSSKMVE